MKLKPAGYFVLVEVQKVEEVSQGGIVLPSSLVDKEQAVEETGKILAFGPTCFVGMRGCERDDISAPEQWGVKIGDRVEFKKYEGKRSYVEGYENYRYIPDTHIIGVISDE